MSTTIDRPKPIIGPEPHTWRGMLETIRPRIDMTGLRVGRLTVISCAGRGARRQSVWLCRCECGRECVVGQPELRRGKTRSCGCLRAELVKTRGVTHGLSKTPEYKVWVEMRRRCANPNDNSFHNYGGRGIKVCDRWHSFANFVADMGRRPSDRHSIERRDNSRGYEPDNCFWALDLEQARNRRGNKIIVAFGTSRTLAEWSEKTGIPYHTIKARLRFGWEPEIALARPVLQSRKVAR